MSNCHLNFVPIEYNKLDRRDKDHFYEINFFKFINEDVRDIDN
jgi:hypothetical protein